MKKELIQINQAWIVAVLGLFLLSLPLVSEAQSNPTVTYQFDKSVWDQGATVQDNTVTYSTLTYTITITHASATTGVTFGLFGHTVSAAEVTQTAPRLTSTIMSQTTAQTVYKVASTASIVWTNGETNPIAYYYVRVTGGSDSDSNALPTTAPPKAQWALADRIAPSVSYGGGNIVRNVDRDAMSISYSSWSQPITVNELGLQGVQFALFSLTADGIETTMTQAQWTTSTGASNTVYSLSLSNTFTWTQGGADPIQYYYFKLIAGTDFVGNSIPISIPTVPGRSRIDIIPPEVAYEFNSVSESARTTNTITYTSLSYRIVVNERVKNPGNVNFGLYAGKLDGTSEQVQATISKANNVTSTGATVFLVIANEVAWTNGGSANPTVYYYFNIANGTDLGENAIPTTAPPMDRWMLADRLSPSTPTYQFTSLVEDSRTANTITYSALNYTIATNEVGLEDVGFKLYSRTISGVEAELTAPTLSWTSQTNTQTVFDVAAGPLTWTNGGSADPIAYYYVQLTTGTDSVGNAIPAVKPPLESWAIADRIPPTITYDFDTAAWEQGATITSTTVTYNALTLTATVNEVGLKGVSFGLFSRTIGGVEAEVTGGAIASWTTQTIANATETVYDVEMTGGDITWTNGGSADPIAYYYIRAKTGTDFGGNAVPQDVPPVAERGLADRIPPTVTYDFDESAWEQDSNITIDLAAQTATYNTLTYTVTVNEVALSDVNFSLFSRTIGGVETAHSGPTISWTTQTDTQTTYSVTAGPITWTNGGADPIAYYYVRVTTGTDFGGNTVPQAAPPDTEIALADRVPPTVTYTAGTLGESSRTDDTIDYNALSYVVSINERHLSNVSFGLFSYTVLGREREITNSAGVVFTSTERSAVQGSTTTVFDVQMSGGPIVWQSREADPVAYYYVRATGGVDFGKNAVPTDIPELADRVIADRIAPKVGYQLDLAEWKDGEARVESNDAKVRYAEVEYGKLKYAIEIDEWHLKNVGFGVFGARRDGGQEVSVNVQTSVVTESTRTASGKYLTDYVVQLGSGQKIVWDSGASNPFKYYYIRVTAGTDFVGNAIPVSAPPIAQRAEAVNIRGIAVAAADDTGETEFYIAIDLGAAVETFSNSSQDDISLTIDNVDEGTIKSVEIIADSLMQGLPESDKVLSAASNSADYSQLKANQSIHFRVKPLGAASGILDGGESAEGSEDFSVTLPPAMVSVRGRGAMVNGRNITDTIKVDADENGEPEIVSFQLHRQDKTMVCTSGVCTLGDIVYRVETTEPLDGFTTAAARSQIRLYRSGNLAVDLNATLAGGATFSALSTTSSTEATEIVRVANENTYLVSFVGLEHSNATSESNSFIAVIGESLFGSTATNAVQDSDGRRLEDCFGAMWYGGAIRTAYRESACVGQDAAETPEPGVPTASAGQTANATGGKRYIARAALGMRDFASRLNHFGFTAGGSTARAEAFRVSDGMRVHFPSLTAGEDHSVEWRFTDNRGFSDNNSRQRQTVRVVRDIYFPRMREFISLSDQTFAATVEVELADATALNLTLNIIDSEASTAVGATVAADALTASANLQIDVGPMTTYRISTAGNVWGIGDPLAELAVGGAAAIGPIPQVQILRVNDLSSRPITFNRVKVDGVGLYQISQATQNLQISYEFVGPAGGSYSATASHSTQATVIREVQVGSITHRSNSGEGELTVTVVWESTNTPETKDAVQWVELQVTHAASGATTKTSAVRVDLPYLREAPSYQMDDNNNGIPDSLEGSNLANALPVVYSEKRTTATVHIEPVGGAKVRVSPLVAKRLAGLSTIDGLFAFRANDVEAAVAAPSGSREEYSFVLYNGLPDVADGEFVAGELGAIVPFPDTRVWAPQKLIGGSWKVVSEADGVRYGLFDSKGMSCPLDTMDANSAYRDGTGKLVSGVQGDCLAIYIQDGSASDSDGKLNGVIVDPLAAVPPQAGGRSGGSGQVDLAQLLGLLSLLLSTLYLTASRRKRSARPPRG